MLIGSNSAQVKINVISHSDHVDSGNLILGIGNSAIAKKGLNSRISLWFQFFREYIKCWYFNKIFTFGHSKIYERLIQKFCFSRTVDWNGFIHSGNFFRTVAILTKPMSKLRNWETSIEVWRSILTNGAFWYYKFLFFKRNLK